MLSSLVGNLVFKIDLLNWLRLLRRHFLPLSRNDFPMCQRGVRDEPISLHQWFGHRISSLNFSCMF